VIKALHSIERRQDIMANTTGQEGAGQPSQEARGTRAQGAKEGTGAAQLGDKVAHKVDDAAERTAAQIREARERVRSGLEAGQSQLGERIRDVGGALRSSARKLDDNEQVASLLTSAGDRVERIATYVDNASRDSVASDLSHFVRSHPGWLFGGAFLTGLALGRLAKSSARATSSFTHQSGGNQPRERLQASGMSSARQYPAPRQSAPYESTTGQSAGTSPSAPQMGGSAGPQTVEQAGGSGTQQVGGPTTQRNEQTGSKAGREASMSKQQPEVKP